MDVDTLYQHEIIGRAAEVAQSPDATQIGLKGVIVGETRNTFTLRKSGDGTVILEKNTTLRVDVEGSVIALDTSKMRFRPEDRIKKLSKARKGKPSRKGRDASKPGRNRNHNN